MSAMTRLEVLPSEAIIDGFKGKVDFYYNMGIPCARKWPRSPGHQRAPGVEAGWAAFSYAAKEWNNLDAETRRAYEKLATGNRLTGRDMAERAYLTGLYRYPPPA